jgi:hypothetical protein
MMSITKESYMTITSGFFNSVSEDRKYNAQQMSEIFDGILIDGVFAAFGGYFLVSENSGMNIQVASGRAWFDHTWTYNDASLGIVVPTADPLLDRIDVVYLEVNTSSGVRANKVDIVEGTPASSPVPPILSQTSTIHQYPLAHIYVAAGVTSIIQDNITNKVGTDDCPFVTGPLEFISTSELLTQWEAQWTTWFDAIKDQLSEEAETNLQNQIWEIVGHINPPPYETTLLAIDSYMNTPVTHRFLVVPLGAYSSWGSYGYTMGDWADTTCKGFFYVPENFVSGMTSTPVVISPGSGNAMLSHTIFYGAIGEAGNNHIHSDYDNIIPIVANQRKKVLPLAITSVAKGDYVALYFGRPADTFEEDTLEAELHMTGWLIEYQGTPGPN